MKTITVNSLRPGQIFSEPVYIDDTNLLVPANIAVRKRDIQHLISWGIETVSTDGEIVTPARADNSSGAAVIAPGKTGFLSRAMHRIGGAGSAAPAAARGPATAPAARPAPAPTAVTAPSTAPAAEMKALPGRKKTINILSLREVPENQDYYRAYTSLIEVMENVFNAYTEKRELPPLVIGKTAGRLLAAVREQKGQIVGFILGGEAHGRQWARSSVNAAILSARMAMALRLPPHKVLQVIGGALLRNIGMLDLPKNIPEDDGKLRLIQAHPSISRRIIRKEFGLSDEAALAAGQHHERWDGKGYPEKLAGEDIDLGARIVAVADAFETMIGESPRRTSMEGSRALKAIYAGNGRRFDPAVVRAFVRTMGIYPAGSFIKLNNNALCRVLSVETNAPLRPKAELLIDENGRTFRPGEGKVYDLIQEKDLFITQALDFGEITKLA
jgi:HD-GYP domain-containing protein (c-di-GMP phosphodiesterase class II)